jgi:hypothetical protein
MTTSEGKELELEVKPLVPERWDDFVELFGEHGAYGGCWCMWWRITRSEFEQGQGAGNRKSMKAIVDSGEIPGLLFYLEGKPVAWCSVAPRENYAALKRSRVLKPIDETRVWSLVCFFVGKEYRNQGLIQPVLEGVIEYVGNEGGKVIEAYPKAPGKKRLPPVSSFMGLPAMFEKAGFEEVARPSKSRVIMRYTI